MYGGPGGAAVKMMKVPTTGYLGPLKMALQPLDHGPFKGSWVMRDQQLMNGQKQSGSGKHESLPSSSGKPGPAWSSSGPSQTGPAPENCLLLPTFILSVAYYPSACPPSPGLPAQPSYTPFPFLLYAPPLSPSGPTVTQALLFLKGKGGGGEREGETASPGLGI